MDRTYLVQAGNFLDIKDEDITGFDSLIECKYMGASEFEMQFDPISHELKNPLNLSLKRVVKNLDDYVLKRGRQKDFNGDFVMVFAKKEDIDEALKRTTLLINNKIDCKSFINIKSYMQNKNPNYNYANFWWDIKNDFFILFGDRNAKRLQIALNKNKEKWHDELFPPEKVSFLSKLKNLFVSI